MNLYIYKFPPTPQKSHHNVDVGKVVMLTNKFTYIPLKCVLSFIFLSLSIHNLTMVFYLLLTYF